MSFIKTLLNTGINATDAQVLETHYAGQPEFVDGLEMIARAVGMNESLPLLPPAGEPWKTIYQYMSGSSDISGAFIGSLAQYNPELQRAITGSITTRMVQIQQFDAAIQASGNPKNRSIAEYVLLLKNMGYQFRYNLCTQSIECNGKPIHDLLAAEIRGKLRAKGIVQTVAAEDAYMAQAWSQRYHPIRDYLTNLKYQGGDAIGEMAGYISDRDGIFPNLIRRWLIGACARVMGFQEQNRMLVLDGPQDMGKDSFVRWLGSGMPEYVYEGPILPDDKDCRLRLMSVWVWDVSELGGTTRRQDREALKAFLTTGMVRERRAYGRYDIQGQSMSSFIGTINNEGGFLSDPTGNRRFMVCKLTSINWAYSKLDVDQIWAQAYDLYSRGESWKLDTDELTTVNDLNESYQIHDLVEESIIKHFQIDPNQRNWFLPTVDIMQHLETKGVKFSNLKSASMDISSALTKLGLEKKVQTVRNQQVRGWIGITTI